MGDDRHRCGIWARRRPSGGRCAAGHSRGGRGAPAGPHAMSGVVTVYATFADRAEAECIGRQMVEERLADCDIILGDAHSVYRWQGQIETATKKAEIGGESGRGGVWE